MAYVPSHRRRTTGPSRGTLGRGVLVVLLLASAFAGSVYAFRRMASNEVNAKKAAEAARMEIPVSGAVSIPAASAAFVDVERAGGQGTAARDAKDGRYHLTLHATLPPIDRASVSYEAWLFSRLPFDYVPLGELTTDTAGAFTLDWEGVAGKDYATYRQVIITRQAKTDDANPGVHVLQATFAD